MAMTHRTEKGGERRPGSRWKWLVAAGCVTLIAPSVAIAQQSTRQNAQGSIQISAQPLDAALLALSRQANVDIVAPASLTANKSGRPVQGVMDAEQALARLLEGSGLTFNRTGVRSYAVVPFVSPTPAAEPKDVGEPIFVKGSRIRGALPSSPVTTVTQEEVRNAGHNDLGEVIRSLPQNFAGGQNPTLTIGAGPNSNNISSASALNLRGLGPDATLTLLNGHRLPYDSASQGIDISSIPIAAIERIEVMTDGGSALYGSDAVGGVANIILKRSFAGVNTSARFGASTDGGNVQQQYSVVGGTSWSRGGLVLAADHNRNTCTTARQRSYTDEMPDETTLFPSQHHYAALLHGNHEIVGGMVLELDAHFSDRKAESVTAESLAGYQAAGASNKSSLRSYAVAPRALIEVGRDWLLTVSGTYGNSTTDLEQVRYLNGTVSGEFPAAYDNRISVVEATIEGPAFELPGGPLRVAAGAGYRNASLDIETLFVTFSEGRDSHYVFGEFLAPIVGGDQQVPGIHRLSLNGAMRYESYPGLDKVVTPRLGVVLSPTPDIDLRGSWGKSFKAPTLFQSYSPSFTLLVSALDVGGSEFGDAATVIYRDGGNPDLIPERATTWTATAGLNPQAIPDLRIEVSYFRIAYRDRVVFPVGRLGEALSTPTYRPFITPNPSEIAIDEAIAAGANGLENYTGAAFDPANVIAIVDNRRTNVAREKARGFDVSILYDLDLGDSGRLNLNGSTSYLDSTRSITLGEPSENLAGTIFNPPHWRGRAGATWETEATSLSLFANYIGGFDDIRQTPTERVEAMTTFDLSARLRGQGFFQGGEVQFSVINALNTKPRRIPISSFIFPPFDSNSHSAIGRFVSFTVRKQW